MRRFVSRAGEKLDHALSAFGIDVLGRFIRNQLQKLIKVSFGVQATGDIEQRGVLVQDGMR